uniref:Uncharacterized protein n=1 Tax=Steinernema glaseri TaxID=37863 RepID=A0A1I8APW2_9BILA
MLRPAVACLFLAVGVSAAPLAENVGTMCFPRQMGMFPFDFENPGRLSHISETITFLNLMMDHRFASFFSTLTDADKQSTKWHFFEVSKPKHLEKLGTEAQIYLNETFHYMNLRPSSLSGKQFREETPKLLARYKALSAEAKADLSENFEEHTKKIQLYTFHLKLDSFLRQLNLVKFLSKVSGNPQGIGKLFGKKDVQFVPPVVFHTSDQWPLAYEFVLSETRRMVNHPNLLELFKSLSDADKKVINDYMVDGSPPRRDNPASLYNMSTAVQNLYYDMHTSIDIPSFIDPTTERFTEQARQIVAKFDALSTEDKAQFRAAFPAMSGHIDGLRFYFKIDSFLDSSESHRRDLEHRKSLYQWAKMPLPKLCW